MICQKCGKEMRKGYLFSSKEGAISFANEMPGFFDMARRADGFVKITGYDMWQRAGVSACCCDACRTILIRF